MQGAWTNPPLARASSSTRPSVSIFAYLSHDQPLVSHGGGKDGSIPSPAQSATQPVLDTSHIARFHHSGVNPITEPLWHITGQGIGGIPLDVCPHLRRRAKAASCGPHESVQRI